MYFISYYTNSGFDVDKISINLFFVESIGETVNTKDSWGRKRQYTPIRMTSGTVYFVVGDGVELRRRIERQ